MGYSALIVWGRSAFRYGRTCRRGPCSGAVAPMLVGETTDRINKNCLLLAVCHGGAFGFTRQVSVNELLDSLLVLLQDV